MTLTLVSKGSEGAMLPSLVVAEKPVEGAGVVMLPPAAAQLVEVPVAAG